jgi:hypothetical protein
MRSQIPIDEWRGALTAFSGFNSILPADSLTNASWEQIRYYTCGNVAVGPDKYKLPFVVPCLLKDAQMTEWGRRLTGKEIGKQRSGAHVTVAMWLIIDVDGLAYVIFKRRMKAMINTGRAFAVFTSWSNGLPEKPGVRARLILPVDRGLDATEYEQAWRGVDELMFDGAVSRADGSGRHLWQQQGVWSVGPDRVDLAFSKHKRGAVWSADELIAAAPKIERPKFTVVHDSSLKPEDFNATHVAWGVSVLDSNDYEVWFNTRAWLKAAYGDAAYGAWLEWSQTADDEHRATEDECAKAWDELIPRIPPGAGAGRFFAVARDAAIEAVRQASASGRWGQREKAALALLRVKFKREYARLFDDRSAA